MTAATAPLFVAPDSPRLKLFSSAVILGGAVLSLVTIGDNASEIDMYRHCAYVMIAALTVAFGIEALAGARALVRIDIVALATLYFLTFAEFLHPHVRVLYMEETGESLFACQLVMIGFAGISIGRHIDIFRTSTKSRTTEDKSLPDLSPRAIARLFFVFAFLSYLYVLLVTQFNVVEIFSSLLQPRFARPWQRGAEGDWRSFLTELQLLTYLLAALGGYIFANVRQFSLPVRIGVTAVLLFMLFFDFAEGARNVVLIKAGLFLVTFFIASRTSQSIRIILVSLAGVVGLWMVSGYMLDFRRAGLSAYLSGAAGESEENGTFMIDNNMVTIARVAQVFPGTYPYPGSEVVTQILTKWVPRALWPSKPVAWTNSMEDALNTGGGYTLAVTYVGEAYLIAGVPSLIIVSLLLGMFASAWTRVGLAARSNLDLIYYASGFFAAALGMRSIQFITVAMVPTIALYVVGKYLASRTAGTRYTALS